MITRGRLIFFLIFTIGTEMSISASCLLTVNNPESFTILEIFWDLHNIKVLLDTLSITFEENRKG